MGIPVRYLVILLATCAAARGQSALSSSGTGTGGRQTAAGIVINSTVGFGGMASLSGTTVKSGFAGGLYDPTSLVVSPVTTTSLYENGYFSFTGVAGLDDGTVLVPSVNAIGWSSGGDPVSNTSPGTYYTLPVYADTFTAITGTYNGMSGVLGLLALDNDPDNYSTAPYDFAHDAVPDSWQATNFTAGSSNAAPAADSDGDGSSVMAEYFFNTDPNSAASAPSNAVQPKIVTVSNVSYFAATIFHRTSLPTLDYAPQVITGLKTDVWVSTPVLVSQTTNSTGMATDTWRDATSTTSSSPRFMRVQISEAED